MAKPKVLLLEDEALVALEEESLLDELGYDVVMATNADEADRLMNLHRQDILFIVTDGDLGGGRNGPTWYADLRDRDQKIGRTTAPAMLVSANSDLVRRAEDMGYSYALSKPFGADAFIGRAGGLAEDALAAQQTQRR